MWAKYIVTARHKSNRSERTLEIGCMGTSEAATYGRIWFPPESYEILSVTMKESSRGR